MIAYMEKNENCKENRFLSMDSLKKNSRFYLVAAFLAAAILALLCVGNGIWKEYRNSAVRNQKDAFSSGKPFRTSGRNHQRICI